MMAYLDNEPTPIKVYIDYRDPSADTYRQIDVCEECAEENNGNLEEACRLQLGEAERCEICGTGSSANHWEFG